MADFLKNSAFSPALICALCVALTYLLAVRNWKLPWKSLSVLLIGLLSAAALAYLLLPVLAEDTETDIAAIAALAMRGLPVYPPPDSAARYILLYGPLTYLSHIPFYLVFGANLFSFKVVGFLSFVVSVLSCYGICRRFADRTASLVGCGCACLLLLRYVPIPFWGRIDSLLFATIAVAYWVAVRASTRMTVIAAALAIGLVPNLKFTAALYLAPLVLLIWMRRGRGPALIASVCGALLLPLPFLLPFVSFSNYLFILHVNSRHGLDAKILLRNFQYVPILLAPVLLMYFQHRTERNPDRKQQSLYLALIAACMLVSAVIGAKAGAGSYHLLPYAIPLLHLYFWIRSSVPPSATVDSAFARYAAAWTLAILLFSAGQIRILATCLRSAHTGAQAIAQIDNTESAYRGKVVEVGAGDDFTDPRTLYAFLPAMHHRPYILNPSSVRDLQFGGAVAIPQTTLAYFEDCKAPVWLIPAGQKPFSALNTYYAQPHLAFDDAFRTTFFSHYRRVGTGPAYDVWACRN